MTGSGRQVGTFLEELARNLRPLVNFLGSLIRVFAGVLLVIFKADVTLIRILFVLSLFTGFGLLLYLLLWVVLPEARTVSEKMRMRGDAVTLSGIE